jgi:hypothetical protein
MHITPRRSIIGCFSRICIAYLVAGSLCAARARADFMTITPQSIPLNPPFSTSSVSGTAVAPSNLIGAQYLGLGLHFGFVGTPFPPGPPPVVGGPPAALIVQQNIYGWAPTGNIKFQVPRIDYGGDLEVYFVKPRTYDQVVTASLTVEVSDTVPHTMVLNAFDAHGKLFQAFNSSLRGPHGGSLLRIDAPNISWFGVGQTYLSPLTGQPWSIEQIQIAPTAFAQPEPASGLLAAIGVIGASLLAWRRAGGR